MDENKKPEKPDGKIWSILATLAMVFVFLIILVGSQGMALSMRDTGTQIESAEDTGYELDDFMKACSDAFVHKYVIRDDTDGYRINNLYKDGSNFYVDFSDYEKHERYLCKVYMSDNKVSKADYSMTNARVKQKLETDKAKMKNDIQIKDYTIFEVSDYNIKDVEGLEKARTTSGGNPFADFVDRNIIEIKETTEE